jgi:hypothetical protein
LVSFFGRPNIGLCLFNATGDFLLLCTSENSKILFTSLKIYEKDPVVDSDLSHKCAKYQCRIIYSLGYTKMASEWIKMHIFKSWNLIGFHHFCIANNTKSFTLKICMLVGYIMYYVRNLLS